MARPSKVAHFQKGKTWYVRYQYKGERIKRSCKTKKESIAKRIAIEIEGLLVDEHISVTSEAYYVFFGQLPDIEGSEETASVLDKFSPNEDKDYVIVSLSDEIKDLKKEVNRLKLVEKRYISLQLDKESRLLSKSDNLPIFSKVLPKYTLNVKHLNIEGRDHIHMVTYLLEYLEMKDKKINLLEPVHINQYLDDYSLTIKKMTDGKFKYFSAPNPPERWNRARRKLFRFWKWLKINYGVDNIIELVETKKQKESADIYWHSVDDIEKELKNKNIYWETIIRVMSFSGLSAHEVRGMKTNDYNGEYLTVQGYSERGIKTKNRLRSIKVHQDHLKKSLDRYLEFRKQVNEKSIWLFPSCVEGSEIWLKDTFSKNFRKQLTNKDINALSLRRTFGSLLLRSGKTLSEVAAAMGNTEEMVRKHYARLLGCEVDIDF